MAESHVLPPDREPERVRFADRTWPLSIVVAVALVALTLGGLLGAVIADAVNALRKLAEEQSETSAVVEALVEAMSDHRSDERVAVGGTANLARFGASFDIDVRPLLEALEEHVVLLKLLGEASAGDTLTVRIGHEGPYQELSSTSVVATGYGPGNEALATLEQAERSHEQQRETIRQGLRELLPGVADVPLPRVVTGVYDVTPDRMPIVGPVPGFDDLWVAAGFGGHGFMLAPAIGAGLARMVCGEEPGEAFVQLAPDRLL